MSPAQRHELIRRHKRDTLATPQSLVSGELWHPMSNEVYRGMLLDSLFEYELDLAELDREA